MESFLVNVVVTCEFVAREKQTSLVTLQKLGKIVNNNFEQTLCLEWAKGSFVSFDLGHSFEESWQTNFWKKILSEFCSWCKELVALHRTVKLPGKSTPIKQVVVQPIRSKRHLRP